MKRNRIIWFCLWLLSLVGISFKGGAVTYGFFALLTLIPVISLIYLVAVYALFHIYQELDNRFVSVNEPVRYRFILVNEYPIQFVGIRVRFFSTFSSITGLDDKTEYELRPDTRIQKETRLICKYRGEYEVGIREIEIQDFFRLFRIRYKNRECIHAVVRPQLIKTDSLGGIELSDAVRESELSRSEPDVLSREYIPGDDRRFINWNQSARTGSLMTRLLTGSNHQEIAIITDTYRYSTDQADFLPAENKILETVLALAYYFSRSNICAAEYHLRDGLIRLTVENTQKFEEFFTFVSDISFSSRNSHQLLCDTVIHRPDILESSMVFLILSSWDTDTGVLLSALEDSGLHIIVCYITDNEDDLPDLSGYKNCTLLQLSPYRDLREVLEG